MNLEKLLSIEPHGLRIFDYKQTIDALPEDFFEAYTHIEWLDISYTKLTALPASFEKLVNLKVLKLHHTKIKNLPDAITHCRELKSLSLWGNTIDFNKEIAKLVDLPQLECLELGGYRGNSLPSNLVQLKELRELRLTNDLKKKLTIKEIFDTVVQLPKLEVLDCDVPIEASEIDESFLKLDHICLKGWGLRFMYRPEEVPLILGRTKNMLFDHPVGEKIIAFRQQYQHLSLPDKQLELLFGLYMKNLTALNTFLPNTLKMWLAELKPTNIILLDKPKGESLKSIKEQLKNFPVTINAKEDADSLIVIGAKTIIEEAKPYIIKGCEVITVDQLKEVLIAEADPWLMQQENESSNEQLLQLLASNQTENYLLGFQIIESGGANKMIQSLLAAIMLSHPDAKVAKAAAKLYDKYGSQSFKHHLEARNLSLKRSGGTDRKVNTIVDHPDIDTFAFRLMHHCIAGSNKNIADIHPDIFQLKNSNEVKISACLPFFTNIKELDFTGCSNLSLDDVIPLLKQMPGCKVLRLNGCKITIPASIGVLTHLQTLEIAYNDVASPDALGSLQHLATLNVEGTKIKEWDWLANLTKLEILNISHNALSAIPPQVFGSISLRELDASQNNLIEISLQILELTNLRFLDCSNNKITSFPYFLAKLHNLGRLLLRSNAIPEFDALQLDKADPNNPLLWKELNLSRNKLTQFSLGALQFQHLRILDISHNSIATLDASLFMHSSLTELYAHHNNIQEIPKAITDKKYFNKLWLHNNRITSLPDYMAEVRIQNCDLSNNQISFIHPDFDTIGKDQYGRLYWKISNNPISDSLGGFGGLYGR